MPRSWCVLSAIVSWSGQPNARASSIMYVQALVTHLQDRLETYKMKVTKVESEKWLQEHRPSLSVDVASANRFISAAIPELTPEQKHALRVVRCNLLLCDCSTAAPTRSGVTGAVPSLGKPSFSGAV